MARKIQILPSEYKASRDPRSLEDRYLLLCSELSHVRAEVKRLESLIRYKNGILRDQADWLEEIYQKNEPQSIDGLKRRISMIKGAIERIQGGLD